MNAQSHGLTSQAALLPSEDPNVYQAFMESIFKQWSPVTDQESRLTEVIGTTEWRLRRIPGLEAGIYAVGLSRTTICSSTNPIPSNAIVTSKASSISFTKSSSRTCLCRSVASRSTQGRHHRTEATAARAHRKAKQAEQALKEERAAIVRSRRQDLLQLFQAEKDFCRPTLGSILQMPNTCTAGRCKTLTMSSPTRL